MRNIVLLKCAAVTRSNCELLRPCSGRRLSSAGQAMCTDSEILCVMTHCICRRRHDGCRGPCLLWQPRPLPGLPCAGPRPDRQHCRPRWRPPAAPQPLPPPPLWRCRPARHECMVEQKHHCCIAAPYGLHPADFSMPREEAGALCFCHALSCCAAAILRNTIWAHSLHTVSTLAFNWLAPWRHHRTLERCLPASHRSLQKMGPAL